MEKQYNSHYKKLEIPTFISSVPDYMISKLTESEAFMVKSISIIEQQSKWLIENILEQNRIAIEIDERISKIEEFKNNLLSKWSIFAGISILIVPAIFSETVKSIISHIWK